VIAVDVGGTGTKAALVTGDPGGVVAVKQQRRATRPGGDAVIGDVAALVDVVDRDIAVVLLTGRPVRVQPQTLDWLARHQLRWDLLVMRNAGNYQHSPEFKRLTVKELRERGFEVKLALEDDHRNIEMFKAEGVPCVYIHSGYYDTQGNA